MKLALFAGDDVGLEMARFIAESGIALACLVLDHKDPKKVNGQIIEAARLEDRDAVLTSDQLKDPETVRWLRSLDLDLGLLAWWVYILREPILGLPKRGYLNLHPSLLPHNKGRDPKFWSIVERVPFGVSIHFIDGGVDTGDIAFQRPLETDWEDTGQSLALRSKKAVVELFKESFPDILAGRIPRRPQGEGQGSFHYKKEAIAASRIELDRSYCARSLLDLLRAKTHDEEPGAWFVDGDERYEVKVQIRRLGGHPEGRDG